VVPAQSGKFALRGVVLGLSILTSYSFGNRILGDYLEASYELI